MVARAPTHAGSGQAVTIDHASLFRNAASDGRSITTPTAEDGAFVISSHVSSWHAALPAISSLFMPAGTYDAIIIDDTVSPRGLAGSNGDASPFFAELCQSHHARQRDGDRRRANDSERGLCRSSPDATTAKPLKP